MALIHEQFTGETPKEEHPKTDAERLEIRAALVNLGGKMVRSTTGLLNDYTNYERINRSHVKIHPAYHLQEGLPADHEVAVWSEYNRGAVSYLQQIVRWQFKGDHQWSTEVTKPRVIAHRAQGFSELPAVANLDSRYMTTEEALLVISNTAETVEFAAAANGYIDADHWTPARLTAQAI